MTDINSLNQSVWIFPSNHHESVRWVQVFFLCSVGDCLPLNLVIISCSCFVLTVIELDIYIPKSIQK